MSELDFHSAVRQLMGHGYSQFEAERQVRAQMPHLTPLTPIETAAENVLERQEQAYIARVLREFGFTVRSTSQARASKVTPGLPDLLLFHREKRFFAFFEVKRADGGRVSPAQQEFAEDCAATATAHFIGDRCVAHQLLVDLGLAILVDGRVEPAHLYAPRKTG